MATITVTATPCSGGGHFKFRMTGDRTSVWETDVAEVTGQITPQDIEGFMRCLVRLGRLGRTNAQAMALFEAGVTVKI